MHIPLSHMYYAMLEMYIYISLNEFNDVAFQSQTNIRSSPR